MGINTNAVKEETTKEDILEWVKNYPDLLSKVFGVLLIEMNEANHLT